MKNTGNGNGFNEAVRYYRNARGLLSRCKVQDDIYEDIKPVREAFGTAWLAVDAAIKAALLEKGLTRKEIPRSWDALLAAVGKYLAVRNGKLIRLLNSTYKLIHLDGYYYGDLDHSRVVKEAMAIARQSIETLSGRKVT